MENEYKVKEEFADNSKTLEELLEEIFVSYFISKISD